MPERWQNGRRMDGAGRQDDFAPRTDIARLAARADADAADMRSVALELQRVDDGPPTTVRFGRPRAGSR